MQVLNDSNSYRRKDPKTYVLTYEDQEITFVTSLNVTLALTGNDKKNGNVIFKTKLVPFQMSQLTVAA